MNLSKATIDRLEYNLRNLYDDQKFMCRLMEDDEYVSNSMCDEFHYWINHKLTVPGEPSGLLTLHCFLCATDPDYELDKKSGTRRKMGDHECFQARIDWWDKQIQNERRN